MLITINEPIKRSDLFNQYKMDISSVFKEFFVLLFPAECFFPCSLQFGYLNDIPYFFMKSKEKDFLLFQNSYLLFDKVKRNYVLKNQKGMFSSKEQLRETNEEVLSFLRLLRSIHFNEKTIFDFSYYDKILTIFDYKQYQIIAACDTIMLALASFYKEDPSGMHLLIVDKETRAIVGFIEYQLNSEFSYRGNVSYEINTAFQNRRYATRALALLRDYIQNTTLVNKDLYIAVEPDNEASKQVVLRNGGKLIYSGEVPVNEQIRFIGKVKKVLLYHIKK